MKDFLLTYLRLCLNFLDIRWAHRFEHDVKYEGTVSKSARVAESAKGYLAMAPRVLEL